MINLSLFASMTGLHLAVLQFCYFFLLLINVTSTYITYMTVVIAWMLGTVIGLWLPISVWASLAVGVMAYYAVYLLVLADPLGSSVLWVAALGVAVTGLWAGRFFVVLQPHFGRADKLFFHENNGFMLGIVGVFVGFTLLGKGFLLWAPLVTMAILMLHYLWLRDHMPEPQAAVPVPEDEVSPAAAPVAASGAPAAWLARLYGAGRQDLRRFGWLMIVLNLLVPAGIFLYAAAIGEDYWYLFWGEDNLITWFSAMQLLMVGGVAWFNAEAGALARRLHGREAARHPWIWWLFAAGFLFLALDEQFRIHEQVRDNFLKPGGLFVDLEYVRPGDVLFYFYFLVGLGLAWFLFSELRRFPGSLWFFGGALVVAASVAVIDALPEARVNTWPMSRFWTSAYEEIGENLAEMLFLLAFLAVLTGRIRWLGERAAEPLREKTAHD